MKRFARLGVVVPLLLSAGCYHAIIDTGRPAGESIVRHFQPSFIYGLVPPPLLNVAGQCPRGIARVETQHTFVEGLVAAITFGIFTPMTLSVTCAGGTAQLPGEQTIHVGQAGAATLEEAVSRAASLSAETGHAVYVRF